MARHIAGRTLARCQALQLLFQAEASGRDVADVIDGGDYALEAGPLDPYGEMLARGAGGMEQVLDQVIDARSEGWAVSRMPAVDRNLLRVAVYEMCVVDDVAAPVSIDEAVELAKVYGTASSPRFVNGLLGRIADELDAGTNPVAEAAGVGARPAASRTDGATAAASAQGEGA